MDGTKRSRKIRSRTRARVTVVLTAALIAGAAPATAAADPAVDFAAGTPAVQKAQTVAQAYWGGVNPCGGQIALRWVSFSPSTNASSTWANPVGQYTAPDQNTDCTITFNSALQWDWVRFCSILVHEYGHLAGHPHSEDPGDVMYAYYNHKVDQCIAAAAADATLAPVAKADLAIASTQPVQTAGSEDSTIGQPTAEAAGRVKVAQLLVVRHPAAHKPRRGKHRMTRARVGRHRHKI